ncbi:MAG: RNA polymerase sigma factor [Caldilineaceae bacterium]
MFMDCFEAVSLLVKEEIHNPAFASAIAHMMNCRQCWETFDWLLTKTFQSTNPYIRNLSYSCLGERLLRVGLTRIRTKPHLYHQAEECVQEALSTIWQKLSRDQGPAQPATILSWCDSIVIHKMYDMLRREGYSLRPEETKTEEAENHSPDDEGFRANGERASPNALSPERDMSRVKRPPPSMQVNMDAIEDLPDPFHLSPEQVASRVIDVERLIHDVMHCASLSSVQRQVLTLSFLYEWTDIEIGVELGRSRGTIRSLRSRALEKLRQEPALIAALHNWFFSNELSRDATVLH